MSPSSDTEDMTMLLVPRLAHFAGVARTEHVTRAAQEMQVPQSTLSRAMVRLGPITQSMLDDLLGEFVVSISANGTIAGNSDTTQRLLLSFLPPDRVDAIMEEIRGPAGRNMWEKLSNVQEQVLANYLKNE